MGSVPILAVQTPSSSPSSSPTPSVQSRPRAGNDVILSYANSNTSGYLAVDDDAWDAMFEAINAKDTVGLMRLVRAGRVHVITAGTRARVLDSAFVSYKVRVMSGPSSGVAGWVPMEFVQR